MANSKKWYNQEDGKLFFMIMTQQTFAGLQDVLKTCLEDVLKMSWRHALKTSWRHVLKMSSNVLGTRKMFTGDIYI